MLSDRLTLAQRKRFGPPVKSMRNGYTDELFNEARAGSRSNATEPEMEEIHRNLITQKAGWKKGEDLSFFETTEVIEHITRRGRAVLSECGTKYKVVTTEK